MKIQLVCAALFLLCACSNAEKQAQQNAKDSIEHIEDKHVEDILKNEDSLMKAKEKELLEKYGK